MRILDNDEIHAVAGGVCGSGALEFLIPDKPFGVDFTDACTRHDLHYTQPAGMARKTADDMFLTDMLDAAGSNVLGQIAAYAYYGAVRAFGGIYFDSSQGTQADAQDMKLTIQDSMAHGIYDTWGGQGMQMIAQNMTSGSTFESEVAAWWQRIEDLAKEQVIVQSVFVPVTTI